MAKLSLYLLQSIFLISIISAQNGALTIDEIDELRIQVMNLIDTFGNDDDPASSKPLIGSIIRLVFHDCAGPYNPGSDVTTLDNDIRLCDGCIDLENLDHSGLQSLAQEPIESICSSWRNKMNRADCWVTIGNIALEYSASLSTTPGDLPPLPYLFGRTECATSPDAVTNLETGGTEFPLAHLGWDPLLAFFVDFFDFTIEEAAVIIGAHTVGRAHGNTGSGFDGKWTSDSFAFNNQFFVNLLNKNSQWDQVTKPTSAFPQWSNEGRGQGEEELMMLNSDIGLIAALEDTNDIDEDTGDVTCRWEDFMLDMSMPTCHREQSFDISLTYARENQVFLDDFVKAWTKIITNNQFYLTKVNATEFNDTRSDDDDDDDDTVNTNTATPIIVSTYCCIANKIPNWNGRCWGAQTESDCYDVAPGNGYRCYWDPSNCRQSQSCLLRGDGCSYGSQCCSERCRPDTKECR